MPPPPGAVCDASGVAMDDWKTEGMTLALVPHSALGGWVVK
jgi:hypothetical protein